MITKTFWGNLLPFLRGIDKAHPGNGVYAYLPDEAFVLALDALFTGKSMKSSTSDVVDEKSK